MWTLTAALASAADIPTPVEPPTDAVLPARFDDQRWEEMDRRSISLGRTSLAVGLASGITGVLGGAVLAAGIGLDEDPLIGVGAATVTVAGLGAAASMPVAMATVQRANRSIRERGVHVSAFQGVLGWTLLAAGTGVVPVMAVGAPYLIPVWYGGVLACVIGQMELNETARTDAGLRRGGTLFREVTLLPDPRGARLLVTF